MPRVIAEFNEPLDLRLEPVEDRRFPVGWVVREPSGATHPLAPRYAEPDQALRDCVAYRDALESQVGALHDALSRDVPVQTRSPRRTRWSVAVLGVALLGLLAALFLPQLPSGFEALFAVSTGAALLALGIQRLDRNDQGALVVAEGSLGALPERASATLVMLQGPVEGNVLAPAVRLVDGAGTLVGYVVPAAAAERPAKGFPLEAMAQRARTEIEQARRDQEVARGAETERHQLETGVRNANLSLKSLRELEEGRQHPSAE